MTQPQAHELAGGRAVVFSAKSPSKETPNEDALAVLNVASRGVPGEERCVLAVADGVGGQPGGGQAARLAIEHLARAVEGVAAEASLREAILDGFESANAAICAMGSGAATTLAVAEIAVTESRGARVRPYHVGDSGVLVVGQRGKLKLQTIFHSPVGYAVEAGLLDENEAIHHRDRHLISNALGDESMRVEVGAVLDLQPRDTLLLASDGLFDNLRTEEIVAAVRKGPLERAVSRVAASCATRMSGKADAKPSKPDDLTVIAFRRR